MTHTSLYKNEAYLIITSFVSIGVLSGYQSFAIALAALLIFPVVNVPKLKISRREASLTKTIDKCVNCK